VALVDLPFTTDEASVAYLAAELTLLRAQLEAWADCGPISDEAVVASAGLYRRLATALDRLRLAAAAGRLEGGWGRLLELRNRSVTEPPEAVLAGLEALEPDAAGTKGAAAGAPGRTPVYLFGNVLPEPGALDLLAACGAHLVEDDLCTGSRQLAAVQLEPGGDVLHRLAREMLAGSPCARTLDIQAPDRLADELTRRALAAGARGVIAHVMKFCDPYLARMPVIRQHLEQAGLPLLVLEGDCTLRSLGQHRTRIEAFVEMLGTR
jgi:benzoyl-CoA reductase/2-hydroxyglutaryl-CoA dehydratase subunit BcrC/BadD/HgdB